jgi:peptidyl-prolyl cis-trans isomerase SurA
MTNFMQHFVHRYFCGLFLLFVSLVLVVIPKTSLYAVTLGWVLASVDNEIITYADYKQFVLESEGKEQKDEVDAGELKKLIEERIILIEAKKKGIEVSDKDVDEAVEELRNRNGTSMKEFENLLVAENWNITAYKKFMKDKMTVARLVNREVNAMVVVTDRELKRYYDAKKNDYLAEPATVELKAIFLRLNEDVSITEITDLKIKALKIVSLLREGADFEQLVEEYSDEPLKSHEGILGRFAPGKLIPLLDRVAFSLKVGEVSDPLWVSEGAYILKIAEKNGESFQPFESVKEDIYNRVFQQKRETLYTEWIKKIWEKSSVKIN